MADYVKKLITENPKSISICFYIEQDNVVKIGKKIKSIVSTNFGKILLRLFPKISKMNGYNWEGFINYYLQKNHPEVMQNMETDSEAGMYVAYYDFSFENEKNADKLMEIIIDVIENKSNILESIKNDGRLIDWNIT
jgi:hypothetical protein